MIGKSRPAWLAIKNYSGSKELDPRPIALVPVHIDVYSSLVTSIGGYSHAFIITDRYEDQGLSVGYVQEMDSSQII